ncbi:MAG: lysylphosphatidylglycerol synthase transmembrane domain-containing protein [Bythopirellula sp.]
MNSSRWESGWRWLRWPLALGVLGWLIIPHLDDLRELVQQGIRWQWLIAALMLRSASLAVTGARWNLLLSSQGIHPPASRVARIVGVGYVCNFILPGTVGGDVAKAGLIVADTPERRKRALATVPLDRAIGLLAFLLLGTLAGLLRWPLIPSPVLRSAVVVMSAISLSGLLSLLFVLLSKSFHYREASNGEDDAVGILQKLMQALRRGTSILQRARGAVLTALLLSLLGHLCLCSASYSCLQAFRAADLPITWSDQLWLVPAAEVPAAFLALPGGLGAREGALAYFYGEFASDPALIERYRGIGVLVGGTYSIVCITLAVLVGLALAAGGPSRESAPAGFPETSGQ